MNYFVNTPIGTIVLDIMNDDKIQAVSKPGQGKGVMIRGKRVAFMVPVKMVDGIWQAEAKYLYAYSFGSELGRFSDAQKKILLAVVESCVKQYAAEHPEQLAQASRDSRNQEKQILYNKIAQKRQELNELEAALEALEEPDYEPCF